MCFDYSSLVDPLVQSCTAFCHNRTQRLEYEHSTVVSFYLDKIRMKTQLGDREAEKNTTKLKTSKKQKKRSVL